MITEGERKKLAPLLEDESPEGVEWAFHCPYHGDSRRSASLNSETRLWNCFGCDEAGSVEALLKDHKEWDLHDYESRSPSELKEEITETKIEGWHQGLLGRRERLVELRERKGITLETMRQFEIGWDADQNAYTIPIRDMHGDISNVRRYQFDVPDDRRKIWSVKGMGTPTLYPIDQLEAPSILICEGEWDALLSIQNGIPAITRTGAADVWKPHWSHFFSDKKVYVCHDADDKGELANEKISMSLRRFAAKVTIIDLPYDITAKHGKDLGDWWMEGHTRKDFTKLALESPDLPTLKEVLHPQDPAEEIRVTVADSFNPEFLEKPLRMEVTVTGKRVPSHLVPKVAALACDMEAGKRCDGCPMNKNSWNGNMEVTVDDDSPLILSMVDSPEFIVHQMIAQAADIPKCDRLRVTTTEARAVEEIYVRPSIEAMKPGFVEDQDFTHRRVYSTVTHDLSSNQTIELLGTLRSNPRNSLSEFQAWKVDKPLNTLDSFELSEEDHAALSIFQQQTNILSKLEEIAEDMATHVTRIYGRADLHMFMDIALHSVLHIPFGDESGKMERGWIDALVMGDTRTGKSEVALRLLDLYGMGEMISCESSTYAGVVGGLDRTPSGAWITRWGTIPVNDRRAVVLDEVSGLRTDEIAQMSSIRSSGRAELTKIQSERALARTRLIWLANPRDSRMSDFAYGVNAIHPLIGNPEDIARFDMAMGVYSEDVDPSLINRDHRNPAPAKYSRELYRTLLQWAWTRKPEQVKWRGQCRQAIYDTALRMGVKYNDYPGLIQVANAKEKIARVSTAIAARTFSTDPTGQQVWVTVEHVKAAEEFLTLIYGHSKFGYEAVSIQQKRDTQKAVKNADKIVELLGNQMGLVNYMRSNPIMDRKIMESILDMSHEACGNFIRDMWKLKAVKIDGQILRVEAPVLELLRGMEDADEVDT